MTNHRHPIHGQGGFSMVLVILTLFAASMLVGGAFAVANDDLPLSAGSRDSKISYAAAEAGLNFYLTRLNQDNDYWSKCQNVDPPKTGEPNPVNKVWDGAGSDPRTWRNVTGSTSQYTLEILPAAGTTYTACDPNVQASVLDSSGTFRVRATGRPSATSTQRRSIVASFRPVGFLDFLYFTYYENEDPQALPTGAARDWATANCAGRFRWDRPSTCKSVTGGYNTEIQFVSGEHIDGPLRSNDSLLICGTPTFGRAGKDAIEPRTTAEYAVADDHCSNGAIFKGKRKPHDDITEPPSSNSELQPVAAAGGYVFKGKTIIRLTGDTMTVTNKGTTTTAKALPANGVIYVAPDPTQGSCQPIQYPAKTAYDEDAGCANVYVSGTYARSLTIAAGNDVIIAPTTSTGTIDWSSADRALTRVNDNALLGLIANNFVRVGHQVTRTSSSCDNSSSAVDDKDLTIQAAILSLQHSFIVDNYTCGDALGDLNVFGAIAQRYRGPVGTSAPTGFKKQYTYDDRLEYRSPPYFMKPIDSPWKIVRAHEQVPAR